MTRSYQDTDNPDFNRHVNIPADLSSIKPLGDFVLVRVIPETDMHAGLIFIPISARDQSKYQAPRIGEVIACGPGDKTLVLICPDCLPDEIWNGSFDDFETHRSADSGMRCHRCGCYSLDNVLEYQEDHVLRDLPPKTGRFPMHVKPGDRVVFWRAPANSVVINDEIYHFLHEEQHILAVLESE
jgi:co-chaperonin GroES (HSP10)